MLNAITAVQKNNHEKIEYALKYRMLNAITAVQKNNHRKIEYAQK